MALNSDNPETGQLKQRVAQRAGECIPVAVRAARPAPESSLVASKRKQLLDDLIATARSAESGDARSADQIIGYGEHGLPS